MPETRTSGEDRPKLKLCFEFLKIYWRALFFVVWPLLLSLLFCIAYDIQKRCLFLVLIIYGFWITECIPETVTALIPLFALPLLNIQETFLTCRTFLQNGLYITSALFNAVTIHYSGLHERLFLLLVLKLGCSPRTIQVSLTVITTCLSIWAASDYVCAMMLIMVTQILTDMDMEEFDSLFLSRMSLTKLKDTDEEMAERPRCLVLAFYFAVIHASAAGGLPYATGTEPNLTFIGLYLIRFADCSISREYWLLANIPGTVIMAFLNCLWLQIVYLRLVPIKPSRSYSAYDHINDMLKTQRFIEKLYAELGPTTWHEYWVGGVFITIISSWSMQRALTYWVSESQMYPYTYFNEIPPTFLITFIMIILPASGSFFKACHRLPTKRPRMPNARLMPWEILEIGVPWGRILVIGACCSLGSAQFQTGLAKNMANILLALFEDQAYLTTLLMTTFISSMLTEFASNVATCGIILPTIIELSILLNIHPILLSFPCTLNCSFGLMFPTASANVKKVTELVEIEYKDLVAASFMPKIICWLTVLVMYRFYGHIFFNDHKTLPQKFWNDTNTYAVNSTCYCPPCLNISDISY